MKKINYLYNIPVNIGDEENPVWKDCLYPKSLPYSVEAEEIAKAEAHNGEHTIVDDGVEEITAPTQLDIIEAQVTYTAMMTDTLLEG